MVEAVTLSGIASTRGTQGSTMATDLDKTPNSSPEEEVWIAISAFEQILEAIPNDRASLEALCHAYEQIGDHVRAREYLLRLGKVIVGERDSASAAQILRQLEGYEDEDEASRAMMRELRGLVDTAKPVAAAMVVETTGAEPVTGGAESYRYEAFNLADELSFAWTLLESNQLTQEEYAALVHDLTELSSSDSDNTVSVLHALELRTFKGLERLMTTVSKECGTPLVTLSSFDLQSSALMSLPLEFMMRRGAVVFDFLGKEALVVILNPYDQQLRTSLEGLLKQKCHFFMALPSDFDKAITRARELFSKV